MQRSSVPDVSRGDSREALVVVPCLNEKSHIASVIGTLLDDPLVNRLRIVVADGGSTDGSREIVSQLAESHPNVRLLENHKRLQSAGVNRAAELYGSAARWLVRLDAHAEYPHGFVSHLISEAQQTGASSVVVGMTSRGRTPFQSAVALAQNTFLGAGGSPHRMGHKEGFVDHGHHALFDMAMFRALKGYEEGLAHNEDAEFDVRLLRAGGRIWLTRKTAVTYFPRDRAVSLYRQYLNYGRGRATTLLRHRMRPRLRQLLPAAVVPALVLLVFSPWYPEAAIPTLLWVSACSLYAAGLWLKTGRSFALLTGFAAMIMHLAWSHGFWLTVLDGPAILVVGWRDRSR